MLCMLLYLYGEWKLTGFFSVVVHQMLKKKNCKLATPSAARLLLYSYVQRNLFDVQDNTTQYLEEVWVACALYELRITFDYCSLHVSTVISYVSQQFRDDCINIIHF
ncbi:hypothetical protein T06_9706 [Trichinella sp. T6]|nr:hypothetical protein T06_9706 [Trichinella sp. T6]